MTAKIDRIQQNMVDGVQLVGVVNWYSNLGLSSSAIILVSHLDYLIKCSLLYYHLRFNSDPLTLNPHLNSSPINFTTSDLTSCFPICHHWFGPQLSNWSCDICWLSKLSVALSGSQLFWATLLAPPSQQKKDQLCHRSRYCQNWCRRQMCCWNGDLWFRSKRGRREKGVRRAVRQWRWGASVGEGPWGFGVRTQSQWNSASPGTSFLDFAIFTSAWPVSFGSSYRGEPAPTTASYT